MQIVFTKTRSDLQKERLKFALFIAVAIHALIIFGIGFKVLQQKSTNRTVEVTLAQFKNQEQPDTANFIAEHNQIGSGKIEEERKLTTNIDTTSHTLLPPTEQRIKQQAKSALSKPILTTTNGSTNTATSPQHSEQDTAQEDLDQISTVKLESLRAELDQLKNKLARMPKTRQLTSLTTKTDEEAAYLYQWIKRAELVGNQNYPEEARRKKLHGDLQLAVIILPNGSIKSIEIIKSSGIRILDLAAIRTVKLAGPFEPFSKEMQLYDQYEIIRTWRYLANESLDTSNP